jgi:pimeloyl-ACP methyl ester carboxylesterase
MTDRDPVLLLPGMMCDAELWRDQIAALKDDAACTVPVLSAATIEAMAADVLRQAPERFALAGLSMGGYVALTIARTAPQRITRLFLANTSARADTPEQQAGRQAAIAHVEAGRFDQVIERLLNVLIHPSRAGDTAMLQRIDAMLRRVGPDFFVRQQRAAAGRPDSRPGLAAIAVPTHVVAGNSDRVIPPDHAAELAAAIPGASFNLFDTCGHLSPIERAADVTDALRRWIAG